MLVVMMGGYNNNHNHELYRDATGNKFGEKGGEVYLLRNIPKDTTMEKMAQGRSLHKFLVDIHYLIVSNFDLKHLSQIFE